MSPAVGWPLRCSNIRSSDREGWRESVTGKSEAEGILLLKFHVKKKKKLILPTRFLYFIIGPVWERTEERILSLHQTFFLPGF